MAPGDIDEVVLLADLGLAIDQESAPRRRRGSGGVRRPRDHMLASSTASEEQTACATEIVSNELAAEQLLVQVSGLEPSAELLAAREALNGCSAD